MFGKKACKNCSNKVSSKYEFCPYCGDSFSGKSKNEDGDFGMLGKNDRFENEFEKIGKEMFGGFGGSIINKMLGNAMKMLEKEMQKEMKDIKKRDMQPRTNFQLFINGKKINTGGINDLNFPAQENRIKRKVKEVPSRYLPQNNLKDFLKLPKEEPKTNVRRFSNKIIYEINMPEVKSVKDLSIIKLENTIEVKGAGKSKAYSKRIPVNFPITNYNFSRGKLVLELGING